MAEKAGNDQPPPYSQNDSCLSNQYGADVGTLKGEAYPQAGGAYPPEARAYIQQGGALPQGYGHSYSQQRYDQPPPYAQNDSGLSNQYGADVGTLKGEAYPQAGGAYPPEARASIQQGGALPQGYGESYSQQTTTAVIVSQPGAACQMVDREQPYDLDFFYPSTTICLCTFICYMCSVFCCKGKKDRRR